MTYGKKRAWIQCQKHRNTFNKILGEKKPLPNKTEKIPTLIEEANIIKI